jgi:hypothetical protein
MVGGAFIQKVRRGHDELGIEAAAWLRVAVAGTARLIVAYARDRERVTGQGQAGAHLTQPGVRG